MSHKSKILSMFRGKIEYRLLRASDRSPINGTQSELIGSITDTTGIYKEIDYRDFSEIVLEIAYPKERIATYEKGIALSFEFEDGAIVEEIVFYDHDDGSGRVHILISGISEETDVSPILKSFLNIESDIPKPSSGVSTHIDVNVDHPPSTGP